jgi:hypothetical protein
VYKNLLAAFSEVLQETSGDPAWRHARNQMNSLRICVCSAARQMITATADTCYYDKALFWMLQEYDDYMQMWCMYIYGKGCLRVQQTKGSVRIQSQNTRIDGPNNDIIFRWRCFARGRNTGLKGKQYLVSYNLRTLFQPHLLRLLFLIVLFCCTDQDSLVFIATRYGLHIPRGRDFPHAPRQASRPTQPPEEWVPFFFPME